MTDAWDKLIAEVPGVFDALANAEPLAKPTSVAYKGKKGIYAFRDGEKIIHVGRTRNLQQRMLSHRTSNHMDTSKNSDFGSLRHDLTVPARLTVVFPGVFALA